MAEKIRAIIFEPKKVPRVELIDNTLDAMQEIVGGYIEVTRPPRQGDDDAIIICNEQGKILGLEPCRAMRYEDGTICDILVGNLIVVSAPAWSEGFEGLTDEQIEKWLKLSEF